MAKQISSGVIFVDAEKELILMIHPTNQKDYWDFPKGRVEDGETTLEAAIREVEEETGITIDKDENKISDLGFHIYNKHKNIHMYVCLDKDIDTSKLSCSEYVDTPHGSFPECDDFEFFSIQDAIDVMCPAMKRVFVYDLEPQIKDLIRHRKQELEYQDLINKQVG